MAYTELNINPSILKWAREESGYNFVEIANKIDVDIDKYKLWEKDGTKIPLGKLKSLANFYKRQLAVFLLPYVPEKTIKPKDFRNLKSSEKNLSKKVLEVLRDVSYFRRLAFDIQGENYWKNRYSWMNEIKKNENKDIFAFLRGLLNINIEDQISWKNESSAYHNWRLAVENRLGILIFQFPMPMDEIHGFCFGDNYPYAIVTNSKHSYTGRIFTVFHELAHILRYQSVMCLYEEVIENQNEEMDCNTFAGSFLVPPQFIKKTDDLNIISFESSKFKVSREVYLRRLKDENIISRSSFFVLLDQIKATYKTKNKQGGFVKPEIKSKSCRGETFFSMILEAIQKNQISYTQASNALDLNINHLLSEI
jgi:Zn-dependent peptidase ImmA (M78 family)